mmetsp:Transcript_2318/g.2413  ORF Transcript_2318/g.2413 Transcript_2318/m.2413 type:complete len:156 (-) Transcript_2318:66-533(-)
MANQAEKKAGKLAVTTMAKYWQSLQIVNVFYFAVQVYYMYFSMWDIMVDLGFTLVSYMSYSSILSCVEMGVQTEYWNDIFIINLFVQVGICFFDWFGYVYLIIPLYALSKIGSMLWSWLVTSSPEEEEPEMDEKTRRKMEKKEKRGERVKYRKIR